MSGDIPCQRPCRNILCRYCAFSQCMDNAVCENQMDAELNLTHAEDNTRGSPFTRSMDMESRTLR